MYAGELGRSSATERSEYAFYRVSVEKIDRLYLHWRSVLDDLKDAGSDDQSYRPSSESEYVASSSNIVPQGKGLTGHWTGELFCDGKTYQATIRVEETDASITGYMVTSTPCIPAGGKKFYGASMREVTCVGEEASKVGTRLYTDRLFNYPDRHNFRVCRRTFHKAMPEA